MGFKYKSVQFGNVGKNQCIASISRLESNHGNVKPECIPVIHATAFHACLIQNWEMINT